jgi:glycosyltransferase involved in cell wall biosynthesis
LFSPKDPQAMMTAIDAALGARSRWPQIAAAARASVARFDLATVADQYLALCGSLTYPLDDL